MRNFAPLLALVGAVGCSAGPTDEVGELAQTVISDQAHGGAPGFFWLPPLVPSPTLVGTFDATRLLRVKISPLIGPAIATIDTRAIHVDPVGRTYGVTWQSKGAGLLPDAVYRVTVFDGTTALGSLDIKVVASAKGVKGVDKAYVPLVVDHPLQLKWFINLCAGVTCRALDCQVGTCNPDTGTCSLSDAPAGTPCTDDGNACTQDVCQRIANPCLKGENCPPGPIGGVERPVIGLPGGSATMGCAHPPKANGTLCDDGNLCTQLDQCISGNCVGGETKVCPDQYCYRYECHPATGHCGAEEERPWGYACTPEQGGAGECGPVHTCIPKPVAYYPFTGNGDDASGNDNDGTVLGATLVPDIVGRADRAYGFNKESSITLPNESRFDLPMFTIGAFVKPTADCEVVKGSDHCDMTIVSKDNADGFGNYVLALRRSGGNTAFHPVLSFRSEDPAHPGVFITHSFEADYTIGSGGCVGTLCNVCDYDHCWWMTPPVKDTSVPRNEWTHVAVSYDGEMIRFYLNGMWIFEAHSTFTPEFVDTAAWIGKRRAPGLDNRPFDGAIDEVRFYDKALDGTQMFYAVRM